MTLRAVTDYTGLITPLHADKPNFVATVAFTTQPFVDAQTLLAGIPGDYDLDAAIGTQLDVVGRWVGVSRDLPVPVANLYFAFDVAGVGWDQGYFQGPFSDTFTIGKLDDDTYRRLIRAKIAANNGDGTIPTTQAILDAYFTNAHTYVVVQDNALVATIVQLFSFDDAARGFDGPAVFYYPGITLTSETEVDMSMTIGIAGVTPSILDLEVLAQNLIPVVPAGVACDFQVSSVSGTPLFGFDVENEYISGFDVGSLGVTPAYLAGLLTGEFN